VAETAREAGIKSKLDAVPSMALGAFEVSPMEMASAYTIFPNGGIRAEPISIINVMNKEGQVLERKSIQMKRAFDAAPVYLTTNLMRGVIDHGTGAGVRARGWLPPAAGKTGTTSSYRDAWFTAFTPGLLALVWVGYDDNVEIKMSGGRAALPIWAHFMRDVDPQGDGDFPSPPGILLVKIDPATGGLTSSACPQGIYEAFIEGTEPNRTCEDVKTATAAAELPEQF
jgi:membrane peptidoglycan carboxypeptidase